MKATYLVLEPQNLALLAVTVGILIYLLSVMSKSKQSVDISHVKILIALTVLSPFMKIAKGFPEVRLEMIIVIFIWFVLLYAHFAKGEKIALAHINVNRWFLFFGLAIVLSIIYSTLFHGQQLIWRDFYEIVKLFIYFLIFNLVAGASFSGSELKRLYYYILAVMFLSALFGFAQFLNIANVNEWLSPYYTSVTQMANLLEQGRITGTVPNPNEFGALMVLACALAFSGLLIFHNKLERLICGLVLFCFSLALFLTLSRTSFIALFVALLLLLLMNYPSMKKLLTLKSFIFSLFMIIVIGAIFLIALPESFFIRIGNIFNLSQALSWHERLIRWEENFAIWQGSPIFGWGPAKADMTTLVDNEWLMLLRRYGIIGISMFMGLMISFFKGFWRVKNEAIDEGKAAITKAMLASLVAYMVYMIALAIYHSLQIMPLFLIMAGLVFSQFKNETKT